MPTFSELECASRLNNSLQAIRKNGGGEQLPLFLSALIIAVFLLTTVPVRAAATESAYRLGVGDTIQIDVHEEPDLSIESRLEESGILTYPLLGEIQIVGRTVKELETLITNGLQGDFLVDPEVRVAVTEYRKVFILGEVNSPGGYPYLPGLTVERATALAGGFTELASKRRIYVKRETASEENRAKADFDTPIYPGDTVIVEQGLF